MPAEHRLLIKAAAMAAYGHLLPQGEKEEKTR